MKKISEMNRGTQQALMIIENNQALLDRALMVVEQDGDLFAEFDDIVGADLPAHARSSVVDWDYIASYLRSEYSTNLFASKGSLSQAIHVLSQQDEYDYVTKNLKKGNRRIAYVSDLGAEVIELDKGDKIDTSYGELWVTGFGSGSIWTSEYVEDLETGRGRSLRWSYVDAIQKGGQGPWIKVRLFKDEEGPYEGQYEVLT